MAQWGEQSGQENWKKQHQESNKSSVIMKAQAQAQPQPHHLNLSSAQPQDLNREMVFYFLFLFLFFEGHILSLFIYSSLISHFHYLETDVVVHQRCFYSFSNTQNLELDS